MSFTEFSILDFIIQLSTGVKIGLSGLLAFWDNFFNYAFGNKKGFGVELD